MNVLIVLEGKFYTGRRAVNTDFAFTNKEDLHAHMEKVNGFKCVQADDIYSEKGTRFDNKKEKYGYDIVTLEVFGTPDEVKEPIKVIVKNPKEVVQLEDLSHDELKQLAKENNIKSWHLKSKESLIEELSTIKGEKSVNK